LYLKSQPSSAAVLEAGAHAVVVGTAIVDPAAITRRIVDAMRATA